MSRGAWVPFVCGFVFAIGLGVSGMTDPGKVLGFLDVSGAWDPSLAVVMAAAVGVSLLVVPRTLRRAHPVLAERFDLPTKKTIDAPLVVGAALFGVGWGLGGFCPGPAIVALASGALAPAMFVASMLAGMAVLSLFRGQTKGLPDPDTKM